MEKKNWNAVNSNGYVAMMKVTKTVAITSCIITVVALIALVALASMI